MPERKHRPLFVVGAGRSGTTLLQQMLDHHSSFSFAWESHFVPVLYEYRKKFGDLSRVENRMVLLDAISRFLGIVWRGRVREPWQQDFDASRRAIAESAHPSFAGVVDACFSWFASRRGKPAWGDKTPGYVNNLPVLLEIFPEARFIHLIRDGRDVACSVMPLSFGPNSLYVSARRWKHSVERGLQFAEEHPTQVMTLRYEDLVDDPESVLHKVCEFLEEDFEPAMLDYHADGGRRVPGSGIHSQIAKPVNRQRLGRWKQELTPGQVRVFEAVAGPLLERMGYERTLPRAKLRVYEKFAGKMAHRLLVLRPFTKPDSLAARARVTVERCLFRLG